MDYTALNEITQTIIKVIQNEINPTIGAKDVFPELLRNNENGVGFYLFHVQENSHYKNYPALGKDNPPVAFTPMALNLFYQLSANWKEEDKEVAYEEQKLMSTAMKALHDHPIIKKTIPLIDHPNGKDIDIKISLQTLSPSESVQYWAAAESPVRLSAYYEVSVVFLEPEKSKSHAGRVLSYGNYVFVQGPPQITGSQSIIQYKLPKALTYTQVKIQPAQAPIGNKVSFFGTNFSGSNLKLLLISPLWDKPAEADLSWSVVRVSEGQVDMTIQSQIIAMVNNALMPVDIIPGLYSAQINITEHRTLPNGTVKTFTHVSNQFPFSVMPSFTIGPKTTGGVFPVTPISFKFPDVMDNEIQIYIGETILSRSVGPPNFGEFQVSHNTNAGPITITLKVPSGISGADIPFRLLVRGIESVPTWLNL